MNHLPLSAWSKYQITNLHFCIKLNVMSNFVNKPKTILQINHSGLYSVCLYQINTNHINGLKGTSVFPFTMYNEPCSLIIVWLTQLTDWSFGVDLHQAYSYVSKRTDVDFTIDRIRIRFYFNTVVFLIYLFPHIERSGHIYSGN